MSRVSIPVEPGAPAPLSPAARAFARDALSPNTRRAYAAQWRLWLGYAEAHGIAPLPAAPEAVANYIAARAAGDSLPGSRRRSGRAAPATLRSALAAIRLAHQAVGETFDTRHPTVAMVLRGIARTSHATVASATPLRGAVVADIVATLSDSLDDPRDCRDAAILALGYGFARRRSELAGLDVDRLGSGHGWLSREATTLDLHLVASKRNPGLAAEHYVMPRQGNALAARVIEAWLAVLDAAPGQPLLRRIARSGRISSERLDPQSIALIVKRRVAEHMVRRGLSAEHAREAVRHCSGHSLRAGFAVTAAEAGAGLVAIQGALGHKTPLMAAHYARPAELARTSPLRLPGVGLDRPRRSRRRKKEGPLR